MSEFPETRTARALGTLWSFIWPLLFLCAMTVLSMATQKHSGYVEPHTVQAHPAQPTPAATR